MKATRSRSRKLRRKTRKVRGKQRAGSLNYFRNASNLLRQMNTAPSVAELHEQIQPILPVSQERLEQLLDFLEAFLNLYYKQLNALTATDLKEVGILMDYLMVEDELLYYWSEEVKHRLNKNDLDKYIDTQRGLWETRLYTKLVETLVEWGTRTTEVEGRLLVLPTVPKPDPLFFYVLKYDDKKLLKYLTNKHILTKAAIYIFRKHAKEGSKVRDWVVKYDKSHRDRWEKGQGNIFQTMNDTSLNEYYTA